MNNNYKLKKWLQILFIGILFLILFTPIVSADTGPKPSLDIIVLGMDTDEYWLDLLVKNNSSRSWLEITKEERMKLSKLTEYYDDEGFHPALLGGTYVPLAGKLKGEKQDDGSFLHKFSYVGVPELFKIAILKQDGTLIISDIVNRTQFQSVMTYDLRNVKITEDIVLSAGKVSEMIPWINMLIYFGIRLILTLLIEIAIALMFGFTFKKSFKVLLITNIATQIILNGIILFSDSTVNLFTGILIFIIVEFLIIIVELITYLKFLTEKSKIWIAVYTIIANLMSIVVGFMLFFIS